MASEGRQTINCSLGNHPDAPAHGTHERNACLYMQCVHLSMRVFVCVSHGATSVFCLWDVDPCELTEEWIIKKQKMETSLVFFLLPLHRLESGKSLSLCSRSISKP